MTNAYDLKDKVVLMTGGGSGIGREIVKQFLANGAKVALAGRRIKKLQETVSGYPKTCVLPIGADISKPETAQQLVLETENHFGRIDIVVSDAAAYTNATLSDTTEEAWQRVRSTNIDGFFYLAKAAYPALKKTRGNFVAISSVSGAGGDWAQAVYNASKHAINGFVRSLALDWGADGVRINAVAPALTLTEMTKGIGQSDEQLSPYVNRIPLARPAHPEDIAPAVLFLASDDANYITGSILTVDGGTSASTGQPHLD
ncbi:SDR family NAD(P)-dependent oxidoreductase [Loigolactobacillus bifermentans]|uniref:Short-chain dehydrogenase reductase SDR n=1 Tax=Loigolactobacillus bifermentans DSM 20003 TaxID=1423726 RepID=A0A0R1GVF8_9LACO|nr:SDR family oxidoreductase [Loigolactobacillus bifermentans]KRK35210.1 short-chain dehydrogenase reductase SDR [Loigolactobacillus bifermentans DSM 20003]QGG59873.1 SDR family oxidoreductase [Loigolactobacillus bifermentans]